MRKKRTYLIIILVSMLIIMIGEIFFLINIVKTDNYNNISLKDNSRNNVNEKQQLGQKVEENINVIQTKDNDTEDLQLKSDDLFAKYYQQANILLQNMTLEEKVGQMFLVRFPRDGVIEQIENYHPGGYILFARDFKNETKSSIIEKLEQCQNASKIKLIFGVDEEGGSVVRVSNYSEFRESKFLSPQQIWEKGQLTLILEDSTEKSNLLKSIGINMNLTPVLDIATDPEAFIYERSYGKGTQETCTYASELIKIMNNDGMISVMKHFPGYGNNVDTHTGIAIDERPYDSFKNSDFLPFISGIEAGGPCILVSHNIVKSMDENKPASLSQNVHDILRNDLKFSGIIITDDLDMKAISEYIENSEAAIQAVLAGNDIIITSDFEKQRQEVIDAVNQGVISEEIINTAVRRILALKYMYEIM